MSFLNTAVDRVYVINMDKDTERMKRFHEQMHKHGIAYTRVPGVVGASVEYHEGLSGFCNQFCTAGMKGCALSHRMIWEDMLKNRYENVAVFEDDAVLHEDFNAKLRQGWEQLPNDYDIYYIGCDTFCENTDPSSKVFNKIFQTDPEVVDQNLKSVSGSHGTHGYILSEKCARVILDAQIHWHVDTQILKWINEFNLNAYSITPVIVHVNETGGSGISDSFPKLLNSLIHPIHIFGTRPLDWALSENIIQIGWYSFNYLLLMLSVFMMFLPYRVCVWIIGWICVEGIYAGDVNNTSKYLQVLGGILLVRWTFRKDF